MKFTALKDFWDEELKSQYCEGLSYTVRPKDDLLRSKIQGWLDEGKIVLGDASTAQVTGEGG